MSSILDQTEPILNIPVKFTWNVDPNVFKSDASKAESPLFGAKECFDSTVKFRLHLNLSMSKGDEIFLELVSCNEEPISLHDRIIYQNVTRTSTNYQEISVGKQILVWSNNTIYSKPSNIYCELSFTKPYGFRSLSGLSTDLKTLRKDTIFTDVVFRIGSQKLPAHKNILSARSPVFKAMLCNKNYLENQNGYIEITDMTSEEMEALLEFVYTGQLGNLDKMAPNLLAAAHKYQIDLLVQACELSMTNSITVDNAAVYLSKAEMYNLKYLKAKSLKFINENPNSVMQTDGWTKLIDNNNALLKDLYKGMASGKK